MSGKNSYPYLFSWSFALLSLLIGINHVNHWVDLQLHDTYFSTTGLDVCLAISISSGLIGVVYCSLKKIPVLSFLTVLHLIITFLIFGTLLFYILWSPEKSLVNDFIPGNLSVYQVISFVFLAFLTAQVLWLLNIVIGSVRCFR